MMAAYPRGLKNILHKGLDDVVFLSALRTPITRAYKGGLRNAYPEQMLAAVRHLSLSLSTSCIKIISKTVADLPYST